MPHKNPPHFLRLCLSLSAPPHPLYRNTCQIQYYRTPHSVKPVRPECSSPPYVRNKRSMHLTYLLTAIHAEPRCLHFSLWLTPPLFFCLSSRQTRRGQPRVFSRDCGSFCLQRVSLRTPVQALGSTPTDSSCRRKGLTRRRRGGPCWCNSGPRRWVRRQRRVVVWVKDQAGEFVSVS